MPSIKLANRKEKELTRILSHFLIPMAQAFFMLYIEAYNAFQEYIQDGIDWAKVDFDDNQDCLSLFEKVLNL